jgi:hypothetical protein
MSMEKMVKIIGMSKLNIHAYKRVNVFVSIRCYVPARFHYYLLVIRQVQT